MSRVRSYIKTFLLWELWQGLSVTFLNFFKPGITLNYPEEKSAAIGAVSRPACTAPLPER